LHDWLAKCHAVCDVKYLKKQDDMKQLSVLFIVFTLLMTGTSFSQKGSKLIAKNAEINKEAGGFKFTEGPAVAPDGRVFFVDQPNDHIHVWDEQDGVSLWLQGTGRSNGMYFNEEGQLVVCADEKNQLAYFDSSKKLHVLHEGYAGKHLNAPNDLWIDPQGGIYFTDPYYHRFWWPEGHKEEQDTRGVYYLSPSGEISRVIDDFETPNGLIGTPDGKILYVADIQARKTWKYTIEPDGRLSHKTLFAPNGSDGMTIDNKGNVYLTSGILWVYNKKGKLIDFIYDCKKGLTFTEIYAIIYLY